MAEEKFNSFRNLVVDEITKSNVIITGIPYDNGCSCGKGASLAPTKIRQLSKYLPPFSMDGNDIRKIKIYDNGDILLCNDYFSKIESDALNLLEYDKLNIFLGGDHSISIPLQKSFLQICKRLNKTPVVIHIDAHPDICNYYDGSYYSHACTNKRTLDNGLDPNNLVIIGIRGYEDQEVAFFEKNKQITVYNATCVRQKTVSKIVEEITKKYQDNCLVYISYDIDANDPAFAPGTGTPEAFGLTSLESMKLIVGLFKNLPVKVFDIVEVSPPLDCNDITSWLVLKTLYEVFNELIVCNKI